MIQTCTKCKNYDISISDEPCRECQKAFRRGEGKPNFIASITNADRIRSMADEKLAEYLGGIAECHRGCKLDCGDSCIGAWLGWLRQVVEPDD